LESESVRNLKGEFTKGGGGAAKIESLPYSCRLAEGTDDRICNGSNSDGAKGHIGSSRNGEEAAREP
jgi:hypothetical protein